ncbi:hypothetical protein CCUS01_01765 [Colletotrichum cuscutae]|uniref:Uncharacterized protein n=1 Tax=Colletotrichum cuscutae TaxID=1209917 RepID=A0AAI9UF75_9PEZI|nr:hypothetical protein CCUS01_01765 [Colletotrichum cuscutae]
MSCSTSEKTQKEVDKLFQSHTETTQLSSLHSLDQPRFPHTFVPSVFPSFALTPDRPQQRGAEQEPDLHSQLKSSGSQSHVNVNLNFKHLLINQEGAKQAAAYVSTTKQQQQVKQILEQNPSELKGGNSTSHAVPNPTPQTTRSGRAAKPAGPQQPERTYLAQYCAKALVRGFMVRSDSKEGGPGAWKRKENEATWESEQDQK